MKQAYRGGKETGGEFGVERDEGQKVVNERETKKANNGTGVSKPGKRITVLQITRLK